MKKYLESIGNNSCKAFTCKIRNKTKNKVLIKFADLIKKNKSKIIKQNKKDINFAKRKSLKNTLELVLVIFLSIEKNNLLFLIILIKIKNIKQKY